MDNRPPTQFQSDLGVQIKTTAYATTLIRTWDDLIDTLGWSAWDDAPLFNSLSGCMSYVILVPINHIVHNPVLAVKILEVLQFFLAISGMYLLLRPPEALFDEWALCGGVLYACLPSVAIGLRTNPDIGWTWVLPPFVLWAARRLVGYRGALALPLVGVLCAVAGVWFHVQYLVFSSIPLFVYTALAIYRAKRDGLWVMAVIVGFVLLVASAGWFLFPSILHPLTTDSASRVAQIQNGDIRKLFSQSLVGTIGFVQREYEYSAIGTLWLAFAAGALIWLPAIGFIITRYRNRMFATLTWPLLIALCALLLSFGTLNVLGASIWHALDVLPHFRALRTPDRFVVLPFVFAVMAGIIGLRWYEKRLQRAKLAPLCIWLVAALLFVKFDATQGVLATTSGQEHFEPALAPSTASVQDIAGRTVGLTMINQGSFLDVPIYGVPKPSLFLAWDVAGRWLADGLAASGVYSRAGVGSLITTPNWSTKGGEPPNPSSHARIVPRLARIFQSPQDVLAFRLPDVPNAVSPVLLACFLGGPGLIDDLFTIRDLQSVSLVPGADGSCDRTAYADFDPLDSVVPSHALRSWNGDAVFHGSDIASDADYTFESMRTYLNDPWYRNALDGDPVLSADGRTVHVLESEDAAIDAAIPQKADYTLCVRAFIHGQTILSARAGTRTSSISGRPRLGPQWIALPLGILPTGRATLTLSLSAPGESVSDLNPGIFIDLISLVKGGAPANVQVARRSRTAFAAYALDHFFATEPTGQYSTILFPSDRGPISVNGFSSESVHGSPALLGRVTQSQATFIWNGQQEDGTLSASADADAYGASVAIGVNSCCGASAAVPGVDAQMPARLHRGDRIIVRLANARLGNLARVTRVAMTGAGSTVPTVVTASGQEQVKLDATTSTGRRLLNLPSSDGNEGYHGYAGARLTLPLLFAHHPHSIIATIGATSPGPVGLTLICDGKFKTAVGDGDSSISFDADRPIRRCDFSITWRSDAFVLRDVTVDAIAPTVSRSARVWIPSGTFNVLMEARNGLPATGVRLVLDGRPLAARLSEVRAGYHEITVIGNPDASLLALIDVRASSTSVSQVATQHSRVSRWKVDVPRPTSLRLTEFSDGNWDMVSHNRKITGRRCDLLDTCFYDVPRGAYALRHFVPLDVLVGFIVTALTLCFAGAILLVRPLRGSRHL